MKIRTNKFYFSNSDATADAWGGSGYYKILVSVEVFGLRFVLWRKYR